MRHLPALIALLALLSGSAAVAQDTTIGLRYADERAFEGYTLMDPLRWPVTYLVDNNGEVVHYWESEYRPGNSSYLLDTGNLLRCVQLPDPPERFDIGGVGGRIQELSWNGDLLWQYDIASDTLYQHHDIEWMPNGNVLVIAWEYRTGEEALLAGRDPQLLPANELYPDVILELRPIPPDSAEIVWQWRIWDHLIQDYDAEKENFGVVADHPEKMNINYTARQNFQEPGTPDWNHTNSIDYHPDLDQIVISVREQCEALVIDHSTTTEEAAGSTGGRYGKGGDILYRWGNPQAYQRGTPDDRVFYFQHDIHWIPSGLEGQGNLITFNNGRDRSPSYSTIDEIRPPLLSDGSYFLFAGEPFGPLATEWTYHGFEPGDFYSSFVSGVQRLPNGNTLICSGSEGDIFEVGAHNQIVWFYTNPVDDAGPQPQGVQVPRNQVFRASRYAPDHPALLGRELTPMGPIEIYEQREIQASTPASFELSAYPNPFNAKLTISLSLRQTERVSFKVYNMLGREVAQIPAHSYATGIHEIEFTAGNLPSGTYFILAANDHLETQMTRAVLLK